MDRVLMSRYRLVEEIGQGGMAVVYRAEDLTLNREVAVKILHSYLSDKEEARRRFQREAKVVARLRHENILEIFDYSGLDSNESFIVTEFIHGQTLSKLVDENPITVPEAGALIVAEVCKAVAHAHRLGVIHRDIKPENIMVRADGVLKLTDFGIAQIVDTQKLTLTGQLLGSPAFMAPEMVTGAPLDFRTDVFSLGVLLYRLATGVLPFSGKNPHEVLKKIADGDHRLPSVQYPAVSVDLERIIERALATNPDDRFQSVEDLRQAIGAILNDLSRGDTAEEVKQLCRTSEDYQQTMRAQICDHLLTEARRNTKAGRLSTALRNLNRVLSLQEDNEEVPKLLRQVERRQAFRDAMKLVAQVAVVLGLIGLGALGVWSMSKSTEAQSSGSSSNAQAIGRATQDSMDAAVAVDGTRRTESPDAAQSPPPEDGQVRVVHRGRPRAGRQGHGAHPRNGRHPPTVPQQPLGPRQFTLLPYPTAVKVSVDRGPSRDYGPDLRRLPLAPGPHRIRLSSRYCYPKTITITKDQPGGILRPHLTWRWASLKVVTNASADVQAGPSVGSSGQAIRIPIPKDSLDGSRKVLVKVSASGYHTLQREVTLQAGTHRVLKVHLNPL
ncbi:MAG: serine/threonine protein kinase [Deltaproteobacteria bacterium]|nr:serine/threonine protein kinase [Deltaproteobacteria bacterium]